MRARINLDKDWRFFLGNLSPQDDTAGWGGAKARAYSFGATSATLDDSRWKKVNIPHDFVMEGDYTRKHNEGSDMQKIPEMESIDSRHFAGGSLEGGIGWYRKHFELNDTLQNKRVFLCFGGVYRNSTIYLNEYVVGNHKNGYTGFTYDITDFVNINGSNVLAIRVDSTGREGWWYEGGGIYRHVWIEIKDAAYIEESGVYIASNVDYEKECATISIATEVVNRYLKAKDITVESVIKDASDNIVSRLTGNISVAAWDNSIHKATLSMDNINLWSLENPYLYTLETNIYIDDKKVDGDVTAFGLRHTYFDADNGFFLNGKKVVIKGLCCHHDHAGVGIGATDDIILYRLQSMKAMGANAYRSSHHPPAKELLDYCDRLGLLVFDETRRMSSSKEDLEALRWMIKRDRNHPSIFLWGIGNEEIFSQDRPETIRTTITMRMEVKKLDYTRPITSAVVCWNGKERFEHARNYLDITKELDVMGFNYCKTAWDDYHEVCPLQPIIITEASSNSGTRGCYETNEALGRYYVYDPDNPSKVANKRKAVKLNMGEDEWKYFAERPYLSGIFIWTGIDYRGEPTPLSYPAVFTQFGILDTCAFPKDNFYYYQSWWQDEPVLHIFPHWNHPNKVGEPLTIYCYSNLEEVELFVNDKSYGKKPLEKNWYLSWDNVIYEPGTLHAKGYISGKEILSKKIETTGTPYALALEAYKDTINKDAGTAIIKVSIVDESGRMVPTADDEISFQIEGAGEFLGTGNGNPASHESEKVPHRRAFNGLCQLLVNSNGTVGDIVITATSKSLKKATITIKAI